MTLLMRTLNRRGREWTRRLLFALACLQVFAPATAAIADSWRMDQREPYAHIEQQGATGCAMVHGDDCLLCSIATNAQARPATIMPLPVAVVGGVAERAVVLVPVVQPRFSQTSSRAPPALLG